jgi:hypothetical protein
MYNSNIQLNINLPLDDDELESLKKFMEFLKKLIEDKELAMIEESKTWSQRKKLLKSRTLKTIQEVEEETDEPETEEVEPESEPKQSSYTCVCGSTISDKTRHEKTKKHLEFINLKI